MANEEHLARLKQGVAAWNQWREANPDIQPILAGADLREADLTRADLTCPLVQIIGGMAIELARDAITANAVAPGPTETELFPANNPQGSEGEAHYWYI